MRIKKLNEETQIGVDQLARGEFITDVELKEHMRQMKEEFFKENNLD